LPEGFFRYVAPARVAAYIAIGWQVIGSTRSPHDAQRVAIMEWPAADEPIEPGVAAPIAPERRDCRSRHRSRWGQTGVLIVGDRSLDVSLKRLLGPLRPRSRKF
jgi:hypothetical protein